MKALGATFGKYFLSEKIATGGMAEIYLAKLIGPGGFEKQLVLKLIHPELSDHQKFVEMFVAEAKTLVSLTHGNIVPVYELGVVDGTYFLAMEYIDGPALAALDAEVRAAGERFTPAMAAYVTAELLKGLDYAHRKGESVIHRDISPRNVMLSREGEVKLVDFGLAVTEISQSSRSGKTSLPAGSFPYMSPEQVQQEPLDCTTDLFSAGIILWELLAGEALFARDGADDTLQAVLSADIPPPSSRRAELPAALDDICARALSRDRGTRYPSASAFLTDLSRFLYSLDPPPSAADLAALVARRAPRRIRIREGEQGEAGGTAPLPRTGADAAPDRTAPLPRRGKAGRGTATFATHAAFEDVLAKATPLFPIRALDDPKAAAALGLPDPSPASSAPPARRAGTEAPRGTALALRGVGLIALIGAGIGIGLALSRGAKPPAIDAGATTAIVPPPADASALVMTTPDAASVPPPAMDAGPRDAGTSHARPRADAAVTPRESGVLRVGAKPWGDVYLDGKKLGQAPASWDVPAGMHRVEVRYPVPGQERSETFRIEVQPGVVTSVGVVDFTTP